MSTYQEMFPETRYDFLVSRAPRCLMCGANLVQNISIASPAKWKCWICNYCFELEPPCD